MASRKEYRDFILEQLREIEGISDRKMMGEYLLYINGKLFGGIYDDRFLVKHTASGMKLLGEASEELPYEGAKPMLLVTEVEDKAFLKKLILAMEEELPKPKKKRK